MSRFDKAIKLFDTEVMTKDDIASRRAGVRSRNRFNTFLRRGGLAALAGLAFAHFTYDNDKPEQNRAVCEGNQPFEVQPGMGRNDLLAQIENGTANPNDATASIQRLNPRVNLDMLPDASFFVDNELVRQPITLRLPQECYPVVG